MKNSTLKRFPIFCTCLSITFHSPYLLTGKCLYVQMHSLHVSLNKYPVFMALGKIPKINSRSSDFLPDLLREHQTCKELWIPQTILPSEHLQTSYIKLSRSDLLDFESSNLQGKFIPHTTATNLQRPTCLYIRLSQLMPAFLRKLVSPPLFVGLSEVRTQDTF